MSLGHTLYEDKNLGKWICRKCSRRWVRRPPETQPCMNMTVYDGSVKVPDNLHTVSQWRQRGFKLISGARHTAYRISGDYNDHFKLYDVSQVVEVK